MSLNDQQIEWAKPIWTALSKLFDNNFYAVAGFMGNLQAESGLCPYRLQGDYTYGDNPDYPYPESLSYSHRLSQTLKGQAVQYPITANDFIYNGPGGGGFGLAQWTYYTRKQRYVDFYKQGGGSQAFPCLYNEDIGSIQNAANFLCYELETFYSSFITELKNCSSLKEVSDKVLHQYENPADQSEEVEYERYLLGYDIYRYFTENLPQLVRKDLISVSVNVAEGDKVANGKLEIVGGGEVPPPLLVQSSNDSNIVMDEYGIGHFKEMVYYAGNVTTNVNPLSLNIGLDKDKNKPFLKNSLFFVNGIMMPFSCPISDDYKDNKDKYFNTPSNGGVSSCITGKPLKGLANVLNNCVGGAWAAFNWTFFHNLEYLDKEVYTISNNVNRFLLSPGNGNSCLMTEGGNVAWGLNASGATFKISDNEEKLSAYLISSEDVLNSNSEPPIGGLISWGYTANHVGFIVNYYEKDGDGILCVLESGYNSSGYTWVLRTYKKTDNFRYKGCNPVAFLANPVVVKYQNQYISNELNIYSYPNLRDIDIRFNPPSSEFKFPYSIKCDWYRNNNFIQSSIYMIPKGSGNQLRIKKIRSSDEVRITVTYCNSYGVLKQSNTENIFKLTPSYPALLIPNTKYGKVFTPILNKDNNLTKEALVPVIRRNNKNLAFFAYKTSSNPNSYKFILEEL